MPKWILCCVFLLALSSGFGQSRIPERCSVQAADSLRRSIAPSLPDRAVFEEWLQRKIRQSSTQAVREVITLPVIVHVIHNGEAVGVGTNISEEQIRSQIKVLNEDFRKKPGTPGFNDNPVGADIEIEFCPAVLDMEGNLLKEIGIHRVNRKLMGFKAPPYTISYIQNTINPATYWDPKQYLNIWVVDLPNKELGFAQLPDASGLPGLGGIIHSEQTDGVVIDPSNFGRVGELRAFYDSGRTTTHEMGHWLGLIHISGDGGCGVDDYCEDTPLTDQQHLECKLDASSCGSADMVRNYMDYSDDICMNIFTQDQKTRIRTVLANSPRRGVLANSTVCEMPSIAPVAAFSSNQRSGCQGLNVSFQDESLNNATSWNWAFPGGLPASSFEQDPSVSYIDPGEYDVFLEVSNEFGTHSITKKGYIIVGGIGESQVVFSEDFEGDVSAWEIDNADNSFGWEQFGVQGLITGTRAMYINLYDYSGTGQRDGLISPAIDLRGKKGATLYFEHAYAPFGNDQRDSLIVYASTDNGASYPHRLFAVGEDGNGTLATTANQSTAFSPGSPSDWCFGGQIGALCAEIDITAFDGEKEFRLKFESVNDNGNNLYIDNVRLEALCDTLAFDEVTDWSVFPNPNQGNFNIRIENPSEEKLEIILVSLLGQVLGDEVLQMVPSKKHYQVNFPVAPGSYFLRIKGGRFREAMYISIQP